MGAIMFLGALPIAALNLQIPGNNLKVSINIICMIDEIVWLVYGV
jgi:hypothetical protein